MIGKHNVTFIIGDIESTVLVEDGVVNTTLDTCLLNESTYDVFVVICDDPVYNNTIYSTTLSIIKRNVTVTVEPLNSVKNGENITIIINVFDDNETPVELGEVEIRLFNETITADVVGSSVVLNYTVPTDVIADNYTMGVVYKENNLYNTGSADSNLEVIKTDIRTEVDSISIFVNDEAELNALIIDENNELIVGDVEVIIIIDNDTIISTTATDGVINTIIPTSELTDGIYDLKIVIKESDFYNEGSNTTNLNIELRDATVSIEPINPVKVGESVLIKTKVTENDTLINQGNIIYKINGKTLKDENNNPKIVAVEDGYALLNYTPEDIGFGSYDLTAIFIDRSYNRAVDETELKIIRLDTQVLSNNITIYKGTNSTNLEATIIDENNKLVNGVKVAVKINDITVTHLVSKDGIIQTTLDTSFEEGNYTITIIAGENSIYSSSNIKTTLEIIKRNTTTTIYVEDNSLSVGSSTILTAFVRENGLVMNTGNVIFKINNETIKDENGNDLLVSVDNGIAVLNYTIPQEMGSKNYTITAVFVDNKYYARSEDSINLEITKVNTHVVSQNLVIDEDNMLFTASIVDENNNLVIGNTKVAIKIGGRTLIHLTAENGIINTTLPVDDLSVEEYPITIVTGENSLYNNSRTNNTLVIC
jgi:hypothetical protein